MTESEIAYAAGLLEGEGCFDWNGRARYPRIRCESTDRDVIEWVLNGRSKVEPLLLAIKPWMKGRRASKIRQLLRSYL